MFFFKPMLIKGNFEGIDLVMLSSSTTQNYVQTHSAE